MRRVFSGFRALLALFLVVVLVACGNPGAGPQNPTPVALSSDSISGVTFQPPISASKTVTGTFDENLDVSVLAFRLNDGVPEGAPLGAAMSVSNGGVSTVNEASREHYEALWKPSSAGVDVGSVVRLEVRLPNAPVSAAACSSGVAVARGCLAFVDVQVLTDGFRTGERGADSRTVSTSGDGSLKVRVHVEQGVANVQRVTLADGPVVVSFPSGASVEFPAFGGGGGVEVFVTEHRDPLPSSLEPLEAVTGSVSISFRGEASWAEDAALHVVLPLARLGAGIGSMQSSGSHIAVIGVGGGRSLSSNGLSSEFGLMFSKPKTEKDLSVLDLSPGGLGLGGGQQSNVNVDITIAANAEALMDSFRPAFEGMFSVNRAEIPSVADAATEGCTRAVLNGSLLRSARKGPKDTAVVMVHGWQTLGQFWRGGDNVRNAVHCGGWINVMAAYAHEGGDWQAVRERADLFTFRYDSDFRIEQSGTKLRAELENLRALGYENIVLLGYSMGGIVSVEARQQLGHPNYITGIVTLATPFMGVVLYCDIVRKLDRDYRSSPNGQDYCTHLTEEFGPFQTITGILDYIVPRGGSFDLASYYDGPSYATPNPYLRRLWDNEANFEGIRAVFGDNNAAGFSATAALKAAVRVKFGHWGPNDGGVPVASAVATTKFTKDYGDFTQDSQLKLPVGVGRDHLQVLAGCTLCDNGRAGNQSGYDPYFNNVSIRLLLSIPESQPTESPAAFTLQAPEAYCTPSSLPAIRLNWTASAGARTYEIHRNGDVYAKPESLNTTFENTANVIVGEAYTYFVRARSSTGVMTDSNKVNVTARASCGGLPVDSTERNVIVGGWHYSLALHGDGTVWAWGFNRYGQLGDGTTTNRYEPVQVDGLSGMTSIAASSSHSLALRDDGTVWSWGDNDYGALGDGTTADRYRPVQVVGLSSVTSIAASEGYSLALLDDGTVWAWGRNPNGQLGDGTSTARPLPVQIAELSGVTSIAAGFYHSLALRGDGTLWAWGKNDRGQLGDGTSTDRYQPVRVVELSGVTSIAVGATHTLAVRDDGTIWAWGSNSNGRLGDGTSTDRYQPVRVVELSSVTSIAANTYHSLALLDDGTVWAWGRNQAGQVGDGTSTTRPRPVQIVEFSGVTSVAAGWYHSLALRDDGTVWAWGRNHEGQLGDGTGTDSYEPVQVLGLSGVTVRHP